MMGGGEVGMSGKIALCMIVTDGRLEALERCLESAAPAGMTDNAAFDPTDAELLALVGVVDLGNSPYVGDPTVGADGNCVFQAQTQNLPFKCADGDRSLCGILVERGTYTPVSGETFTVLLGILQD